MDWWWTNILRLKGWTLISKDTPKRPITVALELNILLPSHGSHLGQHWNEINAHRFTFSSRTSMASSFNPFCRSAQKTKRIAFGLFKWESFFQSNWSTTLLSYPFIFPEGLDDVIEMLSNCRRTIKGIPFSFLRVLMKNARDQIGWHLNSFFNLNLESKVANE